MFKQFILFLVITSFFTPGNSLATDAEEAFDDFQMALDFMRKAYVKPNAHDGYRDLREIEQVGPPNPGEDLGHYSNRIAGDVTQILYNGSHFGSIYQRNKSSLVIAFKGTDSVTEWVCTNPWACFKPIASPATGLNTPGQVHKGFIDIYNGLNHATMLAAAQRAGQGQSILRWSLSFMSSNVYPSEIIFVGHSLGGAVAQLAALDAKRYYDQAYVGTQTNFNVITAGAPKLFDEAGIQEFERVLGRNNIVRLENDCDLVPCLPCCCGQANSAGLWSCKWYRPAGALKTGSFCNCNSFGNVISSLFCCASPFCLLSSYCGLGVLGCCALSLNAHRIDSYTTASY